MAVRYFNVMNVYIPIARRMVAEKLWIRVNGRNWPPYDWLWKYGVSFGGFDFEPDLRDPYQLIEQTRAKLQASPDPVLQKKLDGFIQRVEAYYQSGKDELLLKSIETGVWQQV